MLGPHFGDFRHESWGSLSLNGTVLKQRESVSQMSRWGKGFVAMRTTAAPATPPGAATAPGRIANATVEMRIRAVNSIDTGPATSVKTQTR